MATVSIRADFVRRFAEVGFHFRFHGSYCHMWPALLDRFWFSTLPWSPYVAKTSLSYVVKIYVICGQNLCHMWPKSMSYVAKIYVICGQNLCHMWPKSMSYVAKIYVICGQNLCHMWPKSMSYVAKIYVICGQNLCHMWPKSMSYVAKILCHMRPKSMSYVAKIYVICGQNLCHMWPKSMSYVAKIFMSYVAKIYVICGQIILVKCRQNLCHMWPNLCHMWPNHPLDILRHANNPSTSTSCRPYSFENTRSHLNSEVKQSKGRLVPASETGWKYQTVDNSFFIYFCVICDQLTLRF